LMALILRPRFLRRLPGQTPYSRKEEIARSISALSLTGEGRNQAEDSDG
jgi:hypothetical protein